MKKYISILICMAVMFTYNVSAADLNTALLNTAEYVYKAVSTPAIGSVGGEWAVMGLARSGYKTDDEYFRSYVQDAAEYVKKHGGVIDSNKYTEYSRVILALTGAGYNAENVGGYNLLTPLSDYEKTVKQGINGAIWALIAADCGDYKLDTRDLYINYILDKQKSDGGWALSDSMEYSDADVTAMALCALASYTHRTDVLDAVENALILLSQMQTQSGGFKSFGEETAESAAQVILALSELRIPFDDERFVKNGKTVLDNLLSFHTPSGGFKHISAYDKPNLMATEQALCALVAADRFSNGKTSFYSMSDAPKLNIEEKNPDSSVNVPSVISHGKTFDDIQKSKSKFAIEALAQRGIINGRSENLFVPHGNMTRAEFATIVVKALGIMPCDKKIFDDVKENDWFYGYVAAAAEYGIVNGISESLFNPQGTLTRQEAAVMVSRAAVLCGVKNNMELMTARDVLAGFTDYVKVADWAFIPFALCYENGILDSSDIEIMPRREVNREEIAQMLYNLLAGERLL